MLVNSRDMLLEARNKGFAIPATNFIDLDSARTYVDLAEKRGLPLILSFAQAHNNLISLEEAALIGKYLAEKASVPVALHLDHGEDKDFIFRGIDLGFKSVMIDASQEEFEDNIRITKEIVDYASSKDVTVEAELGHVGSGKNYENHQVGDSVYTDKDDVVEFIERTKIDSLAISIGTAHGAYIGTPKLNFTRLKEIAGVTDTPLVLHGGSSSGDENLRFCSLNGISKINIFTDLLNGAYNEIKEDFPEDYIELKEKANRGMERVLNNYYDIFNTEKFNK